MRKLTALLAAAVLAVSGFSNVMSAAPRAQQEQESAAREESATDIREILGVTHAGGYYAFDPSVSYLQEGAERIAEMGTKVIKLWLTTQTITGNYQYNSDWAQFGAQNMVDLLKTPYFRSVLGMDFQTYIFEAHEFDLSEGAQPVNWADGMSAEEKQAVEDLMYDTAKYLMTEYVGSGKNFVLQNWEGDNLFGSGSYTAYTYEGKEYYCNASGARPQTQAERERVDAEIRTRISGFRDWVNARQRGVDRAREEYGSLGVDVQQALEVNFVPAESGETYINPAWPILIETVVPYTDCDLYSYSCWSAKTLPEAATMSERLARYQAAIGETYTDAQGKVQSRRPADGPRIMLGEFGSQEQLGTYDGTAAPVLTDESNRLQRLINQIQIEQALDFGVRYLMYWELYCNELRESADVDVVSGGMAEKNDDVRGFYLIRPDGTYNDTYSYIKSLLAPDDVLLVKDGFAPKSGKSQVYQTNESAYGVEVGGEISAADLKNTERGAFDDKITLEASADGESFTPIALDAVVSVQGAGRAKLTFVNSEPIPGGARYFRVADASAAGDALQISEVKVFRSPSQRLSKLKISGTRTVGGVQQTVAATKFTLSSGEFLQINAEMTDPGWNGSLGYASSNRYIATVDENGMVQGRTNGTCTITVTASGGGLAKPVSVPLEISVRVVGEPLIHDGFDGYTTNGFNDDELKKPDDKKDNFGQHIVADGYTQQFYKTYNMQFYETTVNWLKEDTQDATLAYILDWNEYSSAHVIYETEEDVGGYEVKIINYGAGGALDRVNVYVSEDDITYTKINAYITDSKSIRNDWNIVTIANKQIIPAGMRYVKFEIKYNDVNRWNPQMLEVSVYGEAPIPEEFVDNVKPTLQVEGSYQETYAQGSVLRLHNATYADNFATVEELEYTLRVFYVLDGVELEQQITDGTVTLAAIGMYKIEYRVVDLGGNEAVERIIFKVEEPAAAAAGLSGGAIAGIAVGSCLAAAALAAGAVIIVRKKKHKQTH